MLLTQTSKKNNFRDGRWTMQDKVQQYKGIINLYSRDRIIIERDTNVNRKKQVKELRTLRKDVIEKRVELYDAMCGDRQALRNVLARHPSIMLAFQGLHPSKVVDHVTQLIHNSKKEYDRLCYRKDNITQDLIDYKLEQAELQDRLKFCDYSGAIPEEQTAQYVTALIQNARIKKDVAVSVRVNFKNILDILRKDSLYFDAVLLSLQKDCASQSKCMYRIIQLGQLAVEYVDNKRQDYTVLEKVIKKSMMEREKGLDEVRAQVTTLKKHIVCLLRRDSDVNLKQEVQKSYSEIKIDQDVDELDKVLKNVTTITSVCVYDNIFPRLEDQLFTTNRLVELVKKNSEQRDVLLIKKDHAEVMYTNMLHTMVDTTFQYKEEKVRLKTEVDNQKGRYGKAENDIEYFGKIFANLRVSLQQILDFLSCVRTSADSHKKKEEKKVVDRPVPVESPEEDMEKVINLISEKLIILVRNTFEMKGEVRNIAEELFQKSVMDKIGKVYESDFIESKEFSLVDHIEAWDPQVPSRQEIKARSRQIVEKNAKADYE